MNYLHTMILRKFIYTLFICLPFFLHAQTDSIKHRISFNDTTFSNHAFYLKTSPLTPVDLFNGGSLNLILESHPLQRIGISMELGFYYPFGGYNMQHIYGYRSGFEVRDYYRMKHSKNAEEEYYFGLRYLHRKQNFDMHDSIINGYPQYEKNYHINRNVDVIDLTWGVRFVNQKKFEKEFYLGIGVRYKESILSDITPQEISNRSWGDSWLYPILMSNGSNLVPDILFGMRIGFGCK